MNNYHVPVLLKESVDFLIVDKAGTYVDATFGGGGHSKAILQRLDPNAKLFAFDQDKQALRNDLNDPRLTLMHQNFRFLKNALRVFGIDKVDGVLVDLGISSHQIDTPDRGFSTRFQATLDMRMNQSARQNAASILNLYDEQRLSDIFYHYGELRDARRTAKKIVNQRKHKKINTTTDLKQLVSDQIPPFSRNKYLAKLFQALRIEVNDEINALKEMLMQTADILKPQGRLVVISYHSLEDRLVKHFMRTGLFRGEPQTDLHGNLQTPLKPLNRKVIFPKQQEIKENNRARSAKLRVAIKNG